MLQQREDKPLFTAEADVTINRPLEAVFTFLGTPSEFPKWQLGVVESQQTSDGPLWVGSTGAIVRKAMGHSEEAS